ncbi:Fe-S cluster assembly protein SufD [Asticcacaulis sp. AC402]|uniref:Fe-S cluster assembly protein SufD n=1 Tax=Asticcacaulis sp. AC402 TaxID=1282361 RepID=UPI0003C3F504|nr:Fe-S cluster assembly protein SufD [Asticcacaulis sp. AC402]ESQ75312.1 hypothetical protein ABAC402_09410 [Asticcacaulis sp. AC402]
MNALTPLDIFDPSSYPTRRDEEWKYSDLSRLLREAPERFAPVELDWDALPPQQADGNAVIVNGGFSQTPKILANLADRAHLTYISWGYPKAILGHQGEGHVRIEAGRKVCIFEVYDFGIAPEVHRECTYVGNTALHFYLEEGAHLIRIVILNEPAAAISIRRSTVETSPNSVFKQYVFSTGAKFQRFETHVRHAGHGAEVVLDGAYLLKDKRHFDMTTRVTHAEINGTTSQTIRGLVKDQATAVFQGRILVERGADGTDARMRHQALILNDGAHIRAKPELEIYADDVQCAHGNTIGALDEESLFFCQARGMDEATARGLLTHAFVLPVADGIEDEEIRGKVLEFLEGAGENFHAV